jgi:hypothetical protein
MRALLETVALIIFCVFIMALAFVFDGEPDVWDMWHKAAMGMCK